MFPFLPFYEPEVLPGQGQSGKACLPVWKKSPLVGGLGSNPIPRQIEAQAILYALTYLASCAKNEKFRPLKIRTYC